MKHFKTYFDFLFIRMTLYAMHTGDSFMRRNVAFDGGEKPGMDFFSFKSCKIMPT
jgi:hypothetical protein